MDGIDLALVQTDGVSFLKRGEFPTADLPYTHDERQQVKELLACAETSMRDRDHRPAAFAQLEAALTRRHADLVTQYLQAHKDMLPPIDLIGFHGQTILHRPEKRLTIQLGDGQLLADLTGIPVVFDMRANDMTQGGQGAPLVPAYHRVLRENLSPVDTLHSALADMDPVAIVNIGGISNITYVGEELIAFDCGPGNALIDQWVERHLGITYDQGGTIGCEGQVDPGFVAGYMAHTYFDAAAPKSLDRSDFQLPNDNPVSIETGARSLARVTAEAIFKSAKHFPKMPKLWIICGGGKHNPNIMDDLRELANVNGVAVIAADKAGLEGDFVEAEAWGYLAVRSMYGLPLTYPKTTGCKEPVSGGVLVEPKPYTNGDQEYSVGL